MKLGALKENQAENCWKVCRQLAKDVHVLNRSVLSDSRDLMDCSPAGSSVHGIFQARILKWVGILTPRGSSQTRDWACVSCASCTGRRILYKSATREAPMPYMILARRLKGKIWTLGLEHTEWKRRAQDRAKNVGGTRADTAVLRISD